MMLRLPVFDALQQENTFSLQPEEYAQLKNIMGDLGYGDFLTKEQGRITLAFYKGENVFGVLPTAGGKSFTFQTVARLTDGLTIVISPLISLMKDQTKEARDRMAAYFNSELTSLQKKAITKRIRNGELRLLYISPERLKSAEFKRLLATAKRKVKRIVIDEAHCVVEWGYNFRVKYLHLAKEIEAFEYGLPKGEKIPILLLTATASPWLQKEIIKNLRILIPKNNVVIQREGADRPELNIKIVNFRKDGEKIAWLRKQLLQGGRFYKKRGIIFSTFADKGEALGAMNAETIAEKINGAAKGKIGIYHAGMRLEDRRRVQEEYEKRKYKILVATKAFGMGVNIPKLDFIVHFYPPICLEEYWQEAGRGGREMKVNEGEQCECIVFHGENDRRLLDGFPIFARASKIIGTFMCATTGDLWLESDSLRERGKMRELVRRLYQHGYLRKLGAVTIMRIDFERWRMKKGKADTLKYIHRQIEKEGLDTKQTRRLKSMVTIWCNSTPKLVCVPERMGRTMLAYYNKELNWFTEPDIDALELQDDHINGTERFTIYKIKKTQLSKKDIVHFFKLTNALRERGIAKLDYVFNRFLKKSNGQAKKIILDYLKMPEAPV